MSEIDWVEEASRESFPASDAPAWPELPPDLACPPSRSEVRRGIAYHEAGHAVVGLRMGLRLLGTDILPDLAGGRGHTRFAHPGPWFHPRAGQLGSREREIVDRVLVTFLAGIAAEARIGSVDPGGSGFDLEEIAHDWVSLLADDEPEREAILAAYLTRAERMLADARNWRAVEAVAARLLEQQSLDAPTVSALAA